MPRTSSTDRPRGSRSAAASDGVLVELRHDGVGRHGEVTFPGERHRIQVGDGENRRPMGNALRELARYGQSVWYDSLRRGLLASGELARYVEEDGLSGLTTNPAIYEKAISGSR